MPLALLLACGAGAATGSVGAAPPDAAGATPDPAGATPDAAGAPVRLLERAAAAWQARDLARWVDLWDPRARAAETVFARGAFQADQTTLEWLRSGTPAPDAVDFSVEAQIFATREPNGHLAYWRLTAERGPGGWRFVRRSDTSAVDGLVHLSLSHRAWRARAVSLRLVDFELRLEDGTLFSNPKPLGPTVLVFVGRGRVRVDPQPKAEREQLRRFSGSATLDAPIKWCFVRIDPATFERLVGSSGLEPDPEAASRLEEAQRVFAERSGRSYVLDAPLPGSPWWLLPSPGDAVIDFPWRHGRVLTYALSSGDDEDVNLFDRDRRLQICAYRSPARAAGPRIGAPAVEILDQDLRVRFEPERLELAAVHRMRLRSAATNTLRLRLDDDFRVSSVSSGDGTDLVFFRVRGQGSVVVSLGGIADRERPFTIVTRYAGHHDPAPVEHELLQVARLRGDFSRAPLLDPPPIVYGNRTAWYPRPTEETFSPLSAFLDTPEGWLAVTGGELRSLQNQGKRTVAEYRLSQPGKFVTAIVGRLSEVGLRQTGALTLRAFSTPRSRSAAEEDMRAAERILAFYETRFGRCPYPSLSMVIVDAKVPGGHSPPGLIYVQEAPPVLSQRQAEDPANFSDVTDFFLAHELAHQWFGESVAPAGYRERWLSEAWAQYAAALWVRQREGEGAFRGVMDRMGRWAERHDSAGPIHLGQRIGVLEGDPRLYRAVVYDKGAWVLHMLRGIVGDQAFFAGTRAFLERHRFTRVRTDDLREALEEASGRDLGAYFERWVYETGLPRIVWSRHTRRGPTGYETTVAMRGQQVPGPLPVEIAVTTTGGEEVRRVTLDPPYGSWMIETRKRPRSVAVNEDRGLLARTKRGRVPPPPQ